MTLRRHSLGEIVDDVTRRRRCAPAGVRECPRCDVERLATIFHLLRPFYPRDRLCLFDSPALLLFLAQYGLHPSWVFGVRTQPFEAHCWIQAGDVILNDLLDNVRFFTPIMIA